MQAWTPTYLASIGMEDLRLIGMLGAIPWFVGPSSPAMKLMANMEALLSFICTGYVHGKSSSMCHDMLNVIKSSLISNGMHQMQVKQACAGACEMPRSCRSCSWVQLTGGSRGRHLQWNSGGQAA